VREKAGPGGFLLGVTVQPILKVDGYELIVGSSGDDQFGPVILFGSGGQLGEIDLFDRVQLAHVVQVCRDSCSMSEAGRQLLDASRTCKTSTNDADRLRKYLGRFGIEWNQIVES